MKPNERLCRAILKNAWEKANEDEDELEMPPFPSNVHPEYESYTVERTRRDDGFFEKRIPCMKPTWTDDAFYQDYLRKVIGAVGWETLN